MRSEKSFQFRWRSNDTSETPVESWGTSFSIIQQNRLMATPRKKSWIPRNPTWVFMLWALEWTAVVGWAFENVETAQGPRRGMV